MKRDSKRFTDEEFTVVTNPDSVTQKSQSDGKPQPNDGAVKINPSTGKAIDQKASARQTAPRRLP